MEKINEQIKILREARGLTYEQFGERIGVENSKVLMWEKGTSIPTISETRAVCQEFRTNVGWLVAGIGEMNRNSVDYSADAVDPMEEVEDMVVYEMSCIMEEDEEAKKAVTEAFKGFDGIYFYMNAEQEIKLLGVIQQALYRLKEKMSAE